MSLFEQISQSKQQAKFFSLGSLSQLNHMIFDNGQVIFEKSEKLTQIAAETKQFLSEFVNVQTLTESIKNEVACVIKTLLIIPSPTEQIAYLKRVRPLLEISTSKESLEKRNKDIENLKIHEAIMGLWNTGQDNDYFMTPLMDFLSKKERQEDLETLVENSLDLCMERGYPIAAATFLANPENQVDREKEIAKILELIRSNKDKSDSPGISSWWTYAPLILFAEESNRNIDNQLFEDMVASIDKTIADQNLDETIAGYICEFLVQGDNINKFSHWFDAIVKTYFAYWVVPNKFFNHPEVWSGREQIAIDLRKKAIEGRQWPAIIEQCTNPKVPVPGSIAGEESYEDGLMDKIILKQASGKNGKAGDDAFLRYMAHPEHTTDFYDQDKVKQEIESRLNRVEDFDYKAVVEYYSEANVQDFSSEITVLANTVANHISDKKLRARSLSLLRSYLSDETLPLTLLESVPTNLVVIVVAFKLLGVDENVVRSWQLNEENVVSLLPSLIDLAEIPSNRNIFASIALPFVPRNQENGRKVLVEKITQWLRKIDFLNKVPKELEGKQIINEHLQNIIAIQRENSITSESGNISLAMLRKFQTEVNSLNSQLIQKLTELIRLKEGITFEQIEQFVQDWNGDISSVVVLAAHYSTVYDDGLTYLGNKITEIIEGNAEKKRYDLSNDLTRHQLEPILLSEEVESQNEAIASWRDPGFSLRLESTSETMVSMSDYEVTQKVASELRRRVTNQGHFHAEKLMELLFSHVDNEKAKVLTQLITDCLQINTQQPKNLIGQIAQEVKQTSLSGEQKTILIGLAQLLREISIGKINASNLAITSKKLVTKINAEWPELAELDLVNQDLGVYAVNELNSAIKESVQLSQAELYVSYTTDNPKTLLEIGRYPNSGSCQNFESTGTYNTGLTGYVFDSHIQAACISIIILPEILKANPDALIEASISDVNLNLETAKLHLSDGKTYIVRISRPIARRMIMLGSTTNAEIKNSPTLIAEPTYADSGLSGTPIEEMLDETIAAKRRKLSEQLNVMVLGNDDLKIDSVITVAGSHNKDGHYNDLASGLSGAGGDDYQIKFKGKVN